MDLAGAVTLACEDLDRCSRLVPAFGGRDVPPGLLGSATASVDVGGSLGSPVLTASLAAPSLAVGSLTIGDLDVRVDLDREALGISNVRFALGTNVVNGGGRVRWDDGTVGGSLVASVTDLSTLAPVAASARSASRMAPRMSKAGASPDRSSIASTSAAQSGICASMRNPSTASSPAVLAGRLDPETLGRLGGRASLEVDLERRT